MALLAVPASAGIIQVWVDPVYQEVPLGAGTAVVSLYANIPAENPLTGWGMDLGIGGDMNVSFGPADVVIGPLFDAAAAPDGDGLAGLVAPPGFVFGPNVLLATITLTLNAEGLATLNPGDSNPFPGLGPDFTEGFSNEVDWVEVVYTGGSILVPEPASLILLALAGLIRRR